MQSIETQGPYPGMVIIEGMEEKADPVKPKSVRITWCDAKSFSNEWMDMEQIKDLRLAVCQTEGKLIYEDSQAYYIAQNSQNGSYYNIFLIPKGSVTDPGIQEITGE